MERDPNRNKDKKISVEEVTRRATEYLKRRKKAPQRGVLPIFWQRIRL
jgi:hypothetical protein